MLQAAMKTLVVVQVKPDRTNTYFKPMPAKWDYQLVHVDIGLPIHTTDRDAEVAVLAASVMKGVQRLCE